MHWGFSTVNIGNGFMAFCTFHPYLNGKHNLMCLGFYIGKDWLLKQLIDFLEGSAFWAVVRLPIDLLEMWLFPNSHLLIIANDSRRNSFQECWLAHPTTVGILQITQHWTAVADSSQSAISQFSILLLVTSGIPDLLPTQNAVLKALLKLRCVRSAAPLESTSHRGVQHNPFLTHINRYLLLNDLFFV